MKYRYFSASANESNRSLATFISSGFCFQAILPRFCDFCGRGLHTRIFRILVCLQDQLMSVVWENRPVVETYFIFDSLFSPRHPWQNAELKICTCVLTRLV